MKALLSWLGPAGPGAWLYGLLGALLVAGYGYAASIGWDETSEKGEIPPEVRTVHHGYRSYSYWHDHHHWHGWFFWSTPYRGYRWGK